MNVLHHINKLKKKKELNLIKNIYQKPIVYIMLNVPLFTKWGYQFSSLLFNIFLDIVASVTREGKIINGINIRKEEMKLCLMCRCHDYLCKIINNLQKNLLELISSARSQNIK
jgi:hypothetical protein